MFNAKFRKFMMVRMRCRNINQTNCRIRSQRLITSIRFFKAIFLGKSGRLFQIAGSHGIAFHALPLIFQSFYSGSHLCRNMTAPKNRKLKRFHKLNINRPPPKSQKKFAPPVYHCSRKKTKSDRFFSCPPYVWHTPQTCHSRLDRESPCYNTP